MSIYKKVVWSEGLFLRPQHFQQQDRHIERYIETRCEGLTSYSWGFTEFQLETDLLSIGKFGLRRVVGESAIVPSYAAASYLPIPCCAARASP